ncbi:hypothetical protein FRC16_003375 [Serendipita sp. 398]|nr:hypothetical protein FRC16_003375 [Serendipita sp. 398]
MSKTKQKDLGFVELAAGQDPIVEYVQPRHQCSQFSLCDSSIVAIHGLDGHREQTWTAENGVVWLRDLLPDDIPNARVLSYGYDADTRSFTRTSTHTIFRHAEAFAENLSQLRRMADPKRPIIFLAHSLGGIILKKMLVLCHSDGFNTDGNLRDIYVSTFAILFFGTPHSGANGVPLAELMGRMLSVYMHTNDLVLKDLGRDSSELEDIQRMYLPASNRINTIFFYEEYRTPIFGGMEKLIVPRPSAIIQGDGNAKVVALPADHCQIVKYTGKEDQNYRKVVSYLDELMKAARVKVQENWDRENAHRSIEKGELVPSSQPISPKPCIPVSRNYIQRQSIQDFITEKLLSSIPPKHQPRCILHGLGGGGKTQLASFWIEEHKHKYNRIIVIDASSQEHIEADLETAIRSVGPQYSKATWKDAVAYLSGEKGWIMLFDNADQPDLQLDEYLPNSNHGAILVTTRNRECVAYALDSHFQVGEMTESEAVDLLHSVGKITPSSNMASVAIVREVGMWALAITQAGAYIFKSRRLDKYLATFRKHRDKLMREASLKGRNYKGSTYTAFDLSFGLLPKEAQEFMKVCAFLHHSAIPEALFEESTGSGFQTYTMMKSCPPPDSDKTTISRLKDIFGLEWDDDSFRTLIDSVARGSLVDSFANDNEVFYNIHPLVQTYVQDRLGQSDKVQYAMLAGQLLLGAIRPLKDTSNVWHWQLLLHVEELPMEVKLRYPSHALAFVMVYESTGNRNWGCVLWGHCYSELHQMLGDVQMDFIARTDSPLPMRGDHSIPTQS